MTSRMTKYEEMMAYLRKLDAEGEKLNGAGVIVTVRSGYVSGLMYLYSSDFNKAFVFRDRKQAQDFIDKFARHMVEPKCIDNT